MQSLALNLLFIRRDRMASSMYTMRITPSFVNKHDSTVLEVRIIGVLFCDRCVLKNNNKRDPKSGTNYSYKLKKKVKVGKNIGQQYCWCSLMWLIPLRSLSNCDYELKNLPTVFFGVLHPPHSCTHPHLSCTFVCPARIY